MMLLDLGCGVDTAVDKCAWWRPEGNGKGCDCWVLGSKNGGCEAVEG